MIHHSATDAGCAAEFDQAHRARGWDELGYHFVIGNGTDTPDGAIEVGSRWNTQKHGAHCKTPDNFYNDHGIGICLVGNFEHARPTPAQMESLVRLLRWLVDTCDLTVADIGVHGEITGKTLCPGRYFPKEQLLRRLQGG